MQLDRDGAPFLNVRSPSTTSAGEAAKSGVPRRAQRRRKAPPLSGCRLYGPQTEVRITIRPRLSSEMWFEIEYEHGRFWVLHDAGLSDLVRQIQQGGFYVAERANSQVRRRRK